MVLTRYAENILQSRGNWQMKHGVVSMLVILLMVFGCRNNSANPADSKASETQKLKGTIMRYNQLLSEGYKSLNMNPLQQAATKRQAETLYIHMAALGEGQVRMESTLKNIQFTEVEIQPENKATVKTKEVWDFKHTSIDKKQLVLHEKNFEYLITYELVKEGPRWLVAKVIAKEGDNPNRSKPEKVLQGRFTTMLGEKTK
ncbi:MAG: hypothetical protein H7X83_09775 [Verrucomicrobia bacterium]|nr:hypothetical protein [Deltaproteobacteria bacterium]